MGEKMTLQTCEAVYNHVSQRTQSNVSKVFFFQDREGYQCVQDDQSYALSRQYRHGIFIISFPVKDYFKQKEFSPRAVRALIKLKLIYIFANGICLLVGLSWCH